MSAAAGPAYAAGVSASDTLRFLREPAEVADGGWRAQAERRTVLYPYRIRVP